MEKDRRKLQVLLPYNHLQELAGLKNEVKEMKEAYSSSGPLAKRRQPT
jgi:hypothetical protein